MQILVYAVLLVGLFALQIGLIIAVFRTSRATQDSADLLRRIAKELRFVADVAQEVRPEAIPSAQPLYKR